MAMTAKEYQQLLQSLLPPGAAWPRDEDALLSQLLLALADDLVRSDERAEDLLDEADPRTTLELLDDWERVAGLPDPCAGDVERTLQSRRSDLVTKLTSRGGQSRAYFIDRAATLGHDITITETRPTIAGVMRSGDELVGSHEDRHAWTVSVPVDNTYAFVAGASVAGDELGYWQPVRLECLLERLKPAHSRILWQYPTT